MSDSERRESIGKPWNATPTTGRKTLDDLLERIQVRAAEARRLEENETHPCRGCGADGVKVYLPLCDSCVAKKRQRDAGFYLEHVGAKLEDFPEAVRDRVLDAISERPAVRGIFVCGPAGTGKTRLLAAIAGRLGLVTFGLCRELLRETWDPETQDETIERLASAHLLMLDDIGREGRPTEAVCATLHEILSKRNGNFLLTIATCNTTLEHLAERYDEAIADRMRPWTTIVMGGASRRKR